MIDVPSSSPPSVVNNLITDNRYIGIDCAASASIVNNTISGHLWYGIRSTSSTTSPTITNNIVALNVTGIRRSSSTPMLNNNCVYNPGGNNYYNLSAGATDIQLDPLFVSSATGDYHIQHLSPCINAGLNSAVQPGWLDMDGEPRILPVTGNVDIGADEFTYSIGEAKEFAGNGESVYLNARSPMVTTAKIAGQSAYYVERTDRLCGLRCTGTSLLNPGQTGVLQGIHGHRGW